MHKQRGVIAIAIFLPIIITALASATLCYLISVKMSESICNQTNVLAAENTSMQARSVLLAEFNKMLHNGQLIFNFSEFEAPLDNPVVEFSKSIIHELSEANEYTEINAYIVDENYSTEWLLQGQKLGIQKYRPEVYFNGETLQRVSKRYAIVIEISLKNSNGMSYLYTTEIIVNNLNGIITAKTLYSRRKLFMK